ncbi:MAG TPA: hypothetical protein VN213_20160 [Solirubrobacteraceae bacterium]|nr:hypothetical protein [Solirubrobacteraceae bacterium]
MSVIAETLPGRRGGIRGFAVSNARRRVVLQDSGTVPKREVTGEWGVRFGTAMYPDYARAHPTAWDGSHGGSFLTADEADALAEYLRRAAQWARAQNVFDHPDA